MSIPRWAILASAVATTGAIGCEPYRVEYRSRPRFHTTELVGDMPDRVLLEDGTELVFRTRGEEVPSSRGRGSAEAPKSFQPRYTRDDGKVELRALLPEHVLANTLVCLRSEEYELLWDQMISEQTKLAYRADDQGYEEFEAFFRTHRLELARTINRMLLGVPTRRTVIEGAGEGVIRCRFWPQVAQQFTFKEVYMIREGGLKLLVVK